MPEFDILRLDLPDANAAAKEQMKCFPSTRYMGSKNKILGEIWNTASQIDFSCVVDLFSGSGAVSYMFKCQKKTVISNDYLHMAANIATALIENQSERLQSEDIQLLTLDQGTSDFFVTRTFDGIYYDREDNEFIDRIRCNLSMLAHPYKQALARAALIRACLKKQARGIFTYTGRRYDDGRKDLQLTMREHFVMATNELNAAVFDNGQENRVYNRDAFDLTVPEAALIYMDPPYYSRYSDNDYIRRYHLVEGIARDWSGVEIQMGTKTKKFKTSPSPFATERGAINALETLFDRYRHHPILLSYSSNSLPDKDRILSMLKNHKQAVEVVPVDYRYCIGNQNARGRNKVQEYIFVGC